MSDQAGPPAPEIDTGYAHSARIYNYWLGGKDNFAADREAAEQAIAANPGIVTDVRANRAGPAVRELPRACPPRQRHPRGELAEMTRRVNQRMSGPQATMR